MTEKSSSDSKRRLKSGNKRRILGRSKSNVRASTIAPEKDVKQTELPTHQTKQAPTRLSQVVQPVPVSDPYQLINALNNESVWLPFVRSDAMMKQMDALSERQHTLTQIHFDKELSLLKRLILFANNITHESLSVSTLKKQGIFLRDFKKQLMTLAHLLKNNDFHDLHSKIRDVMNDLKHSIYKYQLEFRPLLVALSNVPIDQVFKNTVWKRIASSITLSNPDQDTIQKLQKEIKETVFNKDQEINTIEQLLNDLTTFQFGPNPSERLIGEILNNAYKESSILSLAAGSLYQLPIHELLFFAVNSIEQANSEGRKALLTFLLELLNSDLQGSILDCDGYSLCWNESIDQLKKTTRSEKEIKLISEIVSRLEKLAAQKKEAYHKTLLKIETTSIELYSLTEDFKNLRQEYEKGFVSLRHLILFTFDAIKRINTQTLGKGYHVEFIKEAQHILKILSTTHDQALINIIDSLLNKKITQNALVIPEWGQLQEVEEDTLEFDSKEINLSLQIEQIAQNTISAENRNKVLNLFLRVFHSGIQDVFKSLALVDMSKSLYQGKPNPLIVKHMSKEKTLTSMIPDLILYKVDTLKETRKSLDESSQLARFFIDIYKMAVTKDLGHVAYMIQQGLKHESLKTFPKIKSFLNDSILNTNTMSQSFPELHRIFDELERLNTFFKTSYKFIAIGDYLSKLAQLQTSVAAPSHGLEGFHRFIQKRLVLGHKHSANTPFTEVLDDLDRGYCDVSQGLLLLDDELKRLSLDDLLHRIHTATRLKLPLLVLQKDNPVSPEQILNKWMEKLLDVISSDAPPSIGKLMAFFQALNQQYSFKDSDKAYSKIVQSWRMRMGSLLDTNKIPPTQALIIREDIEIYSESTQRMFPNHPALVLSLGKLRQMIQTKVHVDPHQYAQAYIKVLDQYLEGTQTEQIKIPKQPSVQRAQHSSEKQFDFDLLEEETHPEVIGYAETWNVFKQLANALMPSPPFSFTNIKETVLLAFPWAISQASDLKKKKLILNLLNVDPNVASTIQKEVTDLVFVALDYISKLAGPHGELTLHNLDRIDQTIMILDKISEQLKDPETLQSDEGIQNYLQMVTNNSSLLKEANTLLYQKLTQQILPTTQEKISPNAPVNNFLRLNEEERNRHLVSQEYPESALTTQLTPPLENNEKDANANVSNQEMDEWLQFVDQFNHDFDEQSSRAKKS